MVEPSATPCPTAPRVREAMVAHPGFEDIGKRMLMAWSEGVRGLRDQRVYAAGAWQAGDAFEGFSAPPKLKAPVPESRPIALAGEAVKRLRQSPHTTSR